jgi:tetratricopeptide (TPR) repeat protein
MRPLRSFSPRSIAVLLAVGGTWWVGCGDAPCGDPVPEVPWPHSVEGFDLALVEALETARGTVLARPDDAAAWMRLGMTYEAHVMLEFAGACYEQVVRLDEGDAKAWYRLAVMRGRNGNVEGALAAYARQGALAPEYAPAHRRRGRFLIGVGRPEEARGAFAAVLALKPGDINAVLGLAEVDLEMGEPGKALERLAAIPRVPPSSRAMFHRLRGTALLRLGRHEEAESDLVLGRGARGGGADPWMREVGGLKVGASAVLLRADRLIDGGQPAAALDLLRGLEERDPDDSRVLTRKGRAHARLSHWREAADALVRASELDRDDLGLALAAASAQLEADDNAGALAAAERILSIEAAHAEAHELRADLLLGAGRLDDAVAAVGAARALGVETAALEVVAGKAEIERSRFAEALPFFTRATELDERTADAWAGRALAQLELGDTGAARIALERLRAIAPEHPLRAALEAALRATAGGGEER